MATATKDPRAGTDEPLADALFEPVRYTCPDNPDFKFVSRLPGMRRGEESLMTTDHFFVNGGFTAKTPEEVETVERMRANPTYSFKPIYREPGPELPFRCRVCAFRTGIPDLFSDHMERHLKDQ
jgi:hypothetical protein